MAVVEDFLNRLSQHIQAQRDRMDPGKATDPVEAGKFLLQMFAAPARMAADTVGLGLEGTAKLGNYGAGEVVLGAEQAQQNLHTLAPRVFTSPANQAVLDQGPLHPQAALDAARNGPDSATAWLAGALAMAMDPANLIPLPAGAEANKLKGAAAAARKSAKFSDLPLHGPALPEGAQAIVDQLATATTPADPAEEAVKSALARLQQPQDLEAIFRRADRVKNLPDVNAASTQAQADLGQATGLYKDVQAQKLAAVNDVKAPLQVNGRLPKGVNQSPDFLQQAEDAKNAVTVLNPGGPQRGQTYNQYLQPFKAKLAQAQAERDDAVGAIRNSLLDTGPSPISPQEASLLSAEPPEGALAGSLRVQEAGQGNDLTRTLVPDTRGQTIGEMNTRMNVLSGGPEYNVGKVDPKWLDPDPKVQAALNADPRSPLNPANTGSPVHAEIDPGTGKAVVTDTDGWFKAEFDPNNVPRNPVGQEASAVASPALAQDGSNPLAERPYLGHMYDMFKVVARDGWLANKASFSQPFKKVGLQDVAGLWAGVNVDTFKNLFNDKIFSHFVLHNEDIAARAMTSNEQLMAYRLAQGETKPWLLLGRAGDYAERLGLNVEDPKFAKTFADNLGASMYELELDTANRLNEMNGLQKAAVGTGLQMLSPTRAVTSLLTAPGNLLITMRHHMFHIFNNVAHTSARTAAFDSAFLPYIENSAKDMLGRASAEGLDISGLVGKGLTDVTDRAGGVLATDGFFNPEEVRRVLGDRYATEWEATVQHGFQLGFDRSKQVMGNYQLDGALGNAEKQIRKFVPFMSWAWRAYPRMGKYALQHPAVTVGLLHLAAVDRQMAQQENRPGYQLGTIGINGDTPFVGLLASVFTPEQEATVRLSPLAMFSPLGGNALSVGMDNQPQAENPYQGAQQVLDVVGGSFNPLIQTAAYVTGADYKAPGNASRYSPIDQYVGSVAGGEVPTIQGPLRAARKAVTGVLPAQFGGAKPDNYDPVEAKAKELVYERTGQPLEALGPTSQYAKEIAGKTGIYKEAEADYLKGNALRTGFNAVSPTSVTATTKTTEARRAEGSPPFDYNTVQEAKDQGLTTVVKAMQAANDQWYKDHPAAAVNRDAPNAKGPDGPKVDPRVAQWEAEHAIMQKVAPRSYAKALADFKASLPKK